PSVRAHFNQTLFGAAYGASALLHLMRGGVDAEMLWTGTDDSCGYGVLDKDATPTPLFHARRLCARYIRYGDWISFPARERHRSAIDCVVARGDDGRRSALVVHLKDEAAAYSLAEIDPRLAESHTLLKIDGETGNQVSCQPVDGSLRFSGY